MCNLVEVESENINGITIEDASILRLCCEAVGLSYNSLGMSEVEVCLGNFVLSMGVSRGSTVSFSFNDILEFKKYYETNNISNSCDKNVSCVMPSASSPTPVVRLRVRPIDLLIVEDILEENNWFYSWDSPDKTILSIYSSNRHNIFVAFNNGFAEIDVIQ